jgi:hypothetical protein
MARVTLLSILLALFAAVHATHRAALSPSDSSNTGANAPTISSILQAMEVDQSNDFISSLLKGEQEQESIEAAKEDSSLDGLMSLEQAERDSLATSKESGKPSSASDAKAAMQDGTMRWAQTIGPLDHSTNPFAMSSLLPSSLAPSSSLPVNQVPFMHPVTREKLEREGTLGKIKTFESTGMNPINNKGNGFLNPNVLAGGKGIQLMPKMCTPALFEVHEIAHPVPRAQFRYHTNCSFYFICELFIHSFIHPCLRYTDGGLCKLSKS